MRRLLALGFVSVLAACAPPSPKGIDRQALIEAVGGSIGDPGACVLLVERGSGKLAWRYGMAPVCKFQRPSCEAGGGTLSVDALAQAAAKGDVRQVSCPNPNGPGSVAWASGPVSVRDKAAHGDLVYAAGMEGERALPGMEIARRLEGALARAGL